MKFFIVALFVAVATASPIEDSGPVEVIVNGVAEGQPIDLSNVVDIKLKEHVNGEVAAATNLLHPYTAVGIAEAAVAAAAAAEPAPSPVVIAHFDDSQSEVLIPQPVVLPAPISPEVIPQPVVLPSPVAPEVVPEPIVVPEPVVLPSPVAPEVVLPVIPEPVVLPSPVAPEVILPEVVVPVPASLPNGEIFNDGIVSVTVNTPQEAGVFSTVQSWFSMVLNYFNGEAQTTQQII